jgi:hypothetical protein
MSYRGRGLVVFVLFLAVVAAGCKSAKESNTGPNKNSSSTASTNKPDKDGVIHSGTGTEKEKPASGKSNVQGKVLYNEKPAADIEVKLCEKFSQFLSGCSGQTFTAKTDSNGEYLIKDVPPGIYEGLTAKVFNTPYYVFATSGIVGSAKYKLEPDETFFASDTSLFKSDLKVSSPKAGSKVAGKGIEAKWEAYPDAAYYKMSVHGDSASGAKTILDYVNKRVDGTSFVMDEELAPGKYTFSVTAYNANDIKLSESSSDIKFDVTGGK